MIGRMLHGLFDRCWRAVATVYRPVPHAAADRSREQTQDDGRVRATVAVLSRSESRQVFGVDIGRRGIQPVFVRVENRSPDVLRLQVVGIDPKYFTPLEAAALNHFSIVRRLSAFGAMGWLFFPLLLLVPLKLLTAWFANGRMDDFFRLRGFRLTPIAAGATAEGFVFTTLDLGTKVVHVRLTAVGPLEASLASGDGVPEPASEFTFTVPVPGIATDYLEREVGRTTSAAAQECTAAELVGRLESLPAATSNARGTRSGDPVNLVVIGQFDELLTAFAARWDESETISLATCWKTLRAFLLGTSYRYSPVSPLHLFGRVQDLALQRTRHSINERLHLRLWLSDLAFQGRPVWVGQVSRDIGVRFTTRAWNLTTHRIDPDVDESRDYCVEDLTLAGRLAATGYVGGVGACSRQAPRRNLTGDPWHSDGRRAVIVVSPTRVG